jgi:hypothetical protein
MRDELPGEDGWMGGWVGGSKRQEERGGVVQIPYPTVVL